LGLNKIPDSLAESVKAGNKTYLVINSTRLSAKPENIGLKTILSFKKADRPKGFNEYVRNGPFETFYLFEVLPNGNL